MMTMTINSIYDAERERIEGIIIMCCLRFRITPAEFTSECKNKMLVNARTAAARLMRDYLKLHYTQIADIINRTHPSVISMLHTLRTNQHLSVVVGGLRMQYERIYLNKK